MSTAVIVTPAISTVRKPRCGIGLKPSSQPDSTERKPQVGLQTPLASIAIASDVSVELSPAQSSDALAPAQKSSELFHQIVADHHAEVWRYLRTLGCSGDLADDLTQETFLTAFRRPFNYMGRAAAKSYLRRAAYHRYLTYLQKRDKTTPLELKSAEIANDTWSRWSCQQKGDSEILDILNHCLSTLPAKSRKALELSLIHI